MNFQSHACNMSHKIILSCIFAQAKKILTLESTFTVNDLPQEHPSGLRLNFMFESREKTTSVFQLPPEFQQTYSSSLPSQTDIMKLTILVSSSVRSE